MAFTIELLCYVARFTSQFKFIFFCSIGSIKLGLIIMLDAIFFLFRSTVVPSSIIGHYHLIVFMPYSLMLYEGVVVPSVPVVSSCWHHCHDAVFLY